MTPLELPIAVRAHTQLARTGDENGSSLWEAVTAWPRYVLFLDTETTADFIQRLLFGSYQLCEWDHHQVGLVCREEGLFYADDLEKIAPAGYECFHEYARSRKANVEAGVPRKLKAMSRTEFVESIFWRIGYQARALIVAFNLPFDLSRLALDCGNARGSSWGGFSFVLWGRWDAENGCVQPHPDRPRIVVEHINSRMAFIRFRRPRRIDPQDQRSADGKPPNRRYSFQGRFADLKTLVSAVTGDSHTLESAGEAFGVAHPKTQIAEHGVITPEYIDYNRRDVLALRELLERLRKELDRHPIDLDPCRAYSSASVVKAYFQAMGLRPPAGQFRGIPLEVIGQTMTAFFGGRTEARIRKTIVPVVCTDFLSMYPTIQSLMELWNLLSAREIEVVEASEEIRELLEQVSVDWCFQPQIWPQLVGFAEVLPDHDILPARAKHDRKDFTVGVNRLSSKEPLWYAIPDLVASVLLTGKMPWILRAFRLIPHGKQRQLKPVSLRGEVEVDPKKENLFRAVIEARQKVKRDRKLSPEERSRLERFLKNLANSGSYGIFVEMNRKENAPGKRETLNVYGRGGHYTCRTRAPENPGNFTFPPVGALITAGARLMLALLERCVTDAGGTYAFADTDSMAIVSSKEGGWVACHGGAGQLPDGTPAIRALPWADVDAIVDRFSALDPYDPDVVPGSILKIEDVNFSGGVRHELQAYVISSKRYALFTVGVDGRPMIHKCSEHGLGLYLNPLDPEREDRDWIRQSWEGLVIEALGGPRFSPPWGDRPAMMRSAVTTPEHLDRFSELNRGKRYADWVKPFNFLLSAPVHQWDRPPNRKHFQLITPYQRNPAKWLGSRWTDTHSGEQFRIRTDLPTSLTGIRVQTYATVLDRFRTHPEAKSAGPDGQPSDARTIGLLGRLDVEASFVFHIGKETNLLEQQEEGVLLTDPQAVYMGNSELKQLRSLLDSDSIPEVAVQSGKSESMLRSIKRGDRIPSAKTMVEIIETITRMRNDRSPE